MMCHVLQSLLRLLQAGDVHENTNVVGKLALAVMDCADGQPLGIDLTRFSAIRDFTLPASMLVERFPHGPVELAIVEA